MSFLKKLNQSGFDHMVLAAFLVLFGGAGITFEVLTHAATTPYVELTLNNNYENDLCFAGGNIGTCSTSNPDMLFAKKLTGKNFQIENKAGLCVEDDSGYYQKFSQVGSSFNRPPSLASCGQTADATDLEWNWVGPGGQELASVGSGNNGCLDDAQAKATNNNPVIMYQCFTSSTTNQWTENWGEVTKNITTANPQVQGLKTVGQATAHITGDKAQTATAFVCTLKPSGATTWTVKSTWNLSSAWNAKNGNWKVEIVDSPSSSTSPKGSTVSAQPANTGPSNTHLNMNVNGKVNNYLYFEGVYTSKSNTTKSTTIVLNPKTAMRPGSLPSC